MDVPERRVIGALLLLLGISFLAVGVYTGHLKSVMEMLETVFRTVLP
jgi:hypothetical protein